MLTFVVPTLSAIFKNLGTPLPATTRFVISLSEFLLHHPVISFGILGLVAAMFAVLASARLKPLHDMLVLRIPVAGELIKKVNTARTARTLASLLSSGVEMTRALAITKDVLQNLEYKKVLAKALVDVERGRALSAVFKQSGRLYPVTMGEMVAVGEETGALAQMLTDIALYHEQEVDTVTKNLSTVLEPVVMIFVGIGVGFFAISMLSPMYSLVGTLSS
jgi:type IV pilus assembly protein PilC